MAFPFFSNWSFALVTVLIFAALFFFKLHCVFFFFFFYSCAIATLSAPPGPPWWLLQQLLHMFETLLLSLIHFMDSSLPFLNIFFMHINLVNEIFQIVCLILFVVNCFFNGCCLIPLYKYVSNLDLVSRGHCRSWTTKAEPVHVLGAGGGGEVEERCCAMKNDYRVNVVTNVP